MTDPFSFWSKNWLVWRIGRRHLDSIAHLARGRGLDIGCGSMPMRSVFAGRCRSLVGLDLLRADGADGLVDVFGSALSLPFRNESFDTALCLQVLEHVPEPEQCLHEAWRILAPGGTLIVTAPHIWHVHLEPHDYYRFTHYGLAYLFRKSGFEIVEIRAMAGYFVTAAARLAYKLAHFDRRGLMFLVRPLMFLVQASGYVLDRVYCDRRETWNYLAVGRKPSADDGGLRRTEEGDPRGLPRGDSPAGSFRTSAGPSPLSSDPPSSRPSSHP